VSLPAISIVTVTVQPVSELIKTADSLLSQTNSKINFEWILVVGKHFDDYKNYLQRFDGKLDIKIFFQPPKGIYDAMNLGLSNSSGKWVWFVNCGDYLKDCYVFKTLEEIFLNNPNVDFVASPVLYTTPQDYWFDVSWPRVIQSNPGLEAHVHHQGALVSRSICQKVNGGFDTSLKLAADGKFLDQAISHSEYLIVDSILCVFVMGGASSKNYIRTVRETASYRKNKRINVHTVFKNWMRQIILQLLIRKGFFTILRPFLQKRSDAVKKMLSLKNF
jgi:glycosyltransferase involved in cell wall biosynthesis